MDEDNPLDRVQAALDELPEEFARFIVAHLQVGLSSYEDDGYSLGKTFTFYASIEGIELAEDCFSPKATLSDLVKNGPVQEAGDGSYHAQILAFRAELAECLEYVDGIIAKAPKGPNG